MQPRKAPPKRHQHPITITRKSKTQIYLPDIYRKLTKDRTRAIPPPPSSPVDLPFIHKKMDISPSRKVLKRQKNELIWKGDMAVPVIYVPGSEKDMIKAGGRGIHVRQDSDARTLTDAQAYGLKRESRKFDDSFPQEKVPCQNKVKPFKLSPPCGDYPNYTWLDTKYYQKLAKGLDVTGMDVIQAFSGYPNIIAHSELIHKWMLGVYR